MTIKGISEDEFRKVLKEHFTPGRAISSHQYLRGREAKLRQIDRAFNSDGKHIFIYGDRGVGKTSLARTAAFIHGSSDGDPPTIECEQTSTAYGLLRDIALKCIPPAHLIDTKTVKKKIGVAPSFLGGGVEQEIVRGKIPEIKSINEGLAIVAYVASLNRKRPVVVIDEFDVIQDQQMRHTMASFLKHVSDQEINVRFIICGIGDSLDEMVGAHLSTGRYLLPIELERLPHDARWEIVCAPASEVGISIDENAGIRIGQISDGYPYYVHLIGEKLLWEAWDDQGDVTQTEPNHFELALREASAEAEPSLKTAYQKATQKYANDYQEVLWAVADDSSLTRQIKEIYESYKGIMERHFPDREVIDNQKFYARMNALRTPAHGQILRTTSAGWYEFRENRLRGYVRLVAERANVQLEPEHHLGGRRNNLLEQYRARDNGPTSTRPARRF